MKNKVILFDIDYTLFDVGKFREIVFEKLQELLPEVPLVKDLAWKSYNEMRERGPFEPESFTKQLLTHLPGSVDSKSLKEIWTDKSILISCLYPETVPVLEKISKNPDIALGIFSSGVDFFQKAKIKTIAHFFSEEHIHIHAIKDEKVASILKSYKDADVYLIDDYFEVLEKAKQADSSLIAIWIKRGKFAERERESLSGFTPDYTIYTLDEVLPLVV